LFFYKKSEDLRVSPVVSKKISKKAVIRNKIKRRIRHLARELKRGDFVIIAKRDISESNFKALENEFKNVGFKIN